MVAVGDDVRRTCTCTLVKWEGPNAPIEPRIVIAYDPAEAGSGDDETIVTTVHNFDATPCRLA